MTKLKIALAAALAVSSIAVAAPEVAAAAPHHGGWHHGGWHHGGRGHKVKVCRTVRHHHHVQRVCHWEYRRW